MQPKLKSQLYGSRLWKALRKMQLSLQPLCVMCESMGVVQASEVIDHIKPHRGDRTLFYNAKNLQSLCKQCHDSHKQRLEKTGKVVGGDIHGNPIDPNHHWN